MRENEGETEIEQGERRSGDITKTRVEAQHKGIYIDEEEEDLSE